MSLGRPWEKEYRILLAEVQQKWGNKLSDEDSAKADEALWSILDPMSYPTFCGKREGKQIVVSFNADVLELAVSRPLGVRLVIRPEGFVDRLLKRIMFWWEFQTGNPSFDRKFFVEDIRPKAARLVVRDRQFQRLVEDLGPFVSLDLGERSVRGFFEIEDASQLTIGYSDMRLGRLSKLAEHTAELVKKTQQ